MKVAILLLAAGRGSRFGGSLPKAYAELDGKPLLVHAAERLATLASATVALRCVVAVHPDDRPGHFARCLPALHAAFGAPAVTVVDGGENRQASMRRCLQAAGDVDFVLVHDAARALVPPAAVRACLEAAERAGAALVAIPAPDTLKRVVDGFVVSTIDRSGIWQAQTPQVVRRDLLVRAMDHAEATGFVGTDDVSLVEHLGERVAVVPGSPANLKITRPEDLPLAAAIHAARLS